MWVLSHHHQRVCLLLDSNISSFHVFSGPLFYAYNASPAHTSLSPNHHQQSINASTFFWLASYLSVLLIFPKVYIFFYSNIWARAYCRHKVTFFLLISSIGSCVFISCLTICYFDEQISAFAKTWFCTHKHDLIS